MIRRLAPCLLPALALALSACSSSGSGSTTAAATTSSTGTSRGTTGSGTGTTTSGASTSTTGGNGGTINSTGTTGSNTTTTGSTATTGSGTTTAGTTTTGTTGTTATTGGGSFLCGFCSANVDCDTGICDVANHVCQTNSCYPADGGDGDCNIFGTSCNVDGTCACPALSGLCGSCFDDSECASGHCDPNAFQCTTATCTATGDLTACQAAGGTCTGATCTCPVPKKALCETCQVGTDCQSGICTVGVCQTASCFAADGGDGECVGNGGTCNTDGSCACAPAVQYAVCQFCNTDADCQTGLYCDPNNFTCQQAGCTGNPTACDAAGLICGGTWNFPDGGANADGCNCYVSVSCGGCSANSDCTSGLCDTTNGVCQVTDCSTNAASCTGLGFVCGGSGGANACNCDLVSTCDYCQANTDCASGSCDTNNNVCLLAPGTPCGTNCTTWGGTCQGDGGCACF